MVKLSYVALIISAEYALSELQTSVRGAIWIMNRVSIRRINELNVLREIFNQAPTSRADVAKNLNLTKSTVYSIFTQLANDNLIYDIGQGSSTSSGGRKPALTNFNANAGYTINTKINNDTISCMTNWLDGSIIAYQEFPVTGKTASQRLLSLYQSIKLSKIEGYDLLGISVAVYGIVRDNHVVRATLSDLPQFDLVQVLQSRFNVPVILGNEANMSALHIRDFTTVKPIKSAVALSLSDGVNAGMIIAGNLYIGARSEAGEVGHALYYGLNSDQPVEIQDVAADSAIFTRLGQMKQTTVNIADLRRWYDDEDSETLQVLKDFCLSISMVLQNLILSFDPEKIVIGSKIMRAIPELLTIVKQQGHFGEDVPLVLAKNVDQNALLGGCALITRHVLGLPTGELVFKNRNSPTMVD